MYTQLLAISVIVKKFYISANEFLNTNFLVDRAFQISVCQLSELLCFFFIFFVFCQNITKVNFLLILRKLCNFLCNIFSRSLNIFIYLLHLVLIFDTVTDDCISTQKRTILFLVVGGCVLLFAVFNVPSVMAWRSHGKTNFDLVRNLKGLFYYFYILSCILQIYSSKLSFII